VTDLASNSSFSRNLTLFYIYQVALAAFWFVPVIVLFWQENGLDPFDIYLLQGLFAVAVVLLEVPTGMVADRLGKRASLLWAAGFLVAGLMVYALGTGFWTFLIGEVVLAVGAALYSGADSAFVYDTLQRLGRQDEFRRVDGLSRGLQMASMAVFMVLGGFMGEVSYRATLWLSALGPMVALLVGLGFVEAGSEKDRAGSYRQLISDSLRFVVKHRLVRWHVLFFAVLIGSSTWLLWLYQPYMQQVGLPVYAFGLAFALFNLFSALCSGMAQRFDDRLGRTGSLGALMLLQVLPLPLMALWMVVPGTLFILAHQAVRGISRPLVNDRLLRYTYADKRATVLSLGSLTGRLFFAVTAPFIGWITKTRTLRVSLLVQGVLLVVILLGMLMTYLRIPNKYFAVKDSVRERQ
jgi:predicted MFS family arabinose efflux permease